MDVSDDEDVKEAGLSKPAVASLVQVFDSDFDGKVDYLKFLSAVGAGEWGEGGRGGGESV